MAALPFNRLLLKTSFFCMASDGKIDDREIAIIKNLCEESSYFQDFDFQDELNQLITKINTRGKEFISYYFEVLNDTELTENEELILIDFALKTINADEKVEYTEIKFFKNIRYRLNISDEKILVQHPDIEMYLEDDIKTDSLLDRITKQYLETAELPQFEFISTDSMSSDKSTDIDSK